MSDRAVSASVSMFSMELESGDEWEVDENGNYIKSVVPCGPSCSGAGPKSPKPVPSHKLCLTQPSMYKTLLDNFKTIDAKVAKLEIEWTTLNNRIDFKTKQLLQLASLRSRRVDLLFGEQMVALKKLIAKNEKSFRKMPKGPLGSCISVRSPSWIPLIECILYPYLFLFLVDNRQDHDVLVKLIDQVYDTCQAGGAASMPLPLPSLDARRKPDVWITCFRTTKRNLSDVRVPVGFGYTTLMDILEIHGKDPNVFSALHEFTNFHQIVLFNNEHDAFLRMGDSFRLPRNARLGYTKNFLKVTPYPHFRTISLYNYATTLRNAPWSPLHGHNPGPHRFQASIASSKVIRDRLRACQRGAKSLSAFMEPPRDRDRVHSQHASLRSVLPPNTITLRSGEVFDIDKASQFYLLPSLTPTIRSLRDEIQAMGVDRNIHKLILQLNRETRLTILSQIETVREQLRA